MELNNDESAVTPAPDSARSRSGWPKENQGRERPVHRRGRSRLAHRHVSRRRRHRQDRHRGFRQRWIFPTCNGRFCTRTPTWAVPEAESAKETIRSLNPHCEVVIHNTRISSENALDLIRPYDIVVDGTDNFPTRYLTNDACVILKKPNVYGSIFRFEGQASVFAPHLGGPCYRCLYPEPPPPGMVPSCAEGGVLGVLPGIIGCIQATEILKLAIGKGNLLVGRLLLFNALDMKFRELKLRRDPACPVCGDHPTIKELIDYEVFCGIEPTPAQKRQSRRSYRAGHEKGIGRSEARHQGH